MSTNVSPEAVKPNLCGRRLCSRHFKHASRHSQAGICSSYFDAGNPFGDVSSCVCSDSCPVFQRASILINGIDFLPCLVGQSCRGSKVSEEVAIRGQNVEFVLRVLFVLFLLELNIVACLSRRQKRSVGDVHHHQRAKLEWIYWCKPWLRSTHPTKCRGKSC